MILLPLPLLFGRLPRFLSCGSTDLPAPTSGVPVRDQGAAHKRALNGMPLRVAGVEQAPGSLDCGLTAFDHSHPKFSSQFLREPVTVHGDCPDFRGEVREKGTAPLALPKGTGPCFRPTSRLKKALSGRKMDQSPTVL